MTLLRDRPKQLIIAEFWPSATWLQIWEFVCCSRTRFMTCQRFEVEPQVSTQISSQNWILNNPMKIGLHFCQTSSNVRLPGTMRAASFSEPSAINLRYFDEIWRLRFHLKAAWVVKKFTAQKARKLRLSWSTKLEFWGIQLQSLCSLLIWALMHNPQNAQRYRQVALL